MMMKTTAQRIRVRPDRKTGDSAISAIPRVIAVMEHLLFYHESRKAKMTAARQADGRMLICGAGSRSQIAIADWL
jgi:hypothetical protein